MHFYSRSTGGFYNQEFHGKIGEDGCKIPADAVPVADDVYRQLLHSQSQGKAIQSDDGGNPISVEITVTPKQILAQKVRALENSVTKGILIAAIAGNDAAIEKIKSIQNEIEKLSA